MIVKIVREKFTKYAKVIKHICNKIHLNPIIGGIFLLKSIHTFFNQSFILNEFCLCREYIEFNILNQTSYTPGDYHKWLEK